MSSHYHTQALSASCLLITAKNWGKTPGTGHSLKRYGTSVLLAWLGVSSGALGWWAGGSKLWSSKHVLSVLAQLSCARRACCQSTFREEKGSRSTVEEYPMHCSGLALTGASQYCLLFASVMRFVDSEVSSIFNVRDSMLVLIWKRNKRTLLSLCFSQIWMISILHPEWLWERMRLVQDAAHGVRCALGMQNNYNLR